MIPIFSFAIFNKVLPRYSLWSFPIFVIIEISESITLVASNLPPSPTSKILNIFFFLLKKIIATTVINSKKLNLIFALISVSKISVRI